ncbi:MAG: inorganic diphosphatase [Rickettsiales bacterium]|nr:inorganic diphosphatase [Rickettsiales bacterium]
MDINKISYGKDAPKEVNVIIEIAGNSDPVKYEICKDSGALFVDRFVQTSMHYPCNYGFIPHTLSEDGDPTDVLVIVDMPLVPGCVIPVRPIGVLLMEDESGLDEKILAVPTKKSHPLYKNIESYKDLEEITIEKIEHFFRNYKALEKDKWVKIIGWDDKNKAQELITEAIERNKTKK